MQGDVNQEYNPDRLIEKMYFRIGEAGLDPKIIGYKRVERCIARWKAENAEKAAETAVENSENQGE